VTAGVFCGTWGRFHITLISTVGGFPEKCGCLDQKMMVSGGQDKCFSLIRSLVHET
jgi:hypothetical protein